MCNSPPQGRCICGPTATKESEEFRLLSASPAATFQFLFRKTVVDPSLKSKTGSPSFSKMLYGIVLNGLLSTPIMMVQMSLFQLISTDVQGYPTIKSLAAIIAVYLLAIVLFSSKDKARDVARLIKCKNGNSRLGNTFSVLFLNLHSSGYGLAASDSHLTLLPLPPCQHGCRRP